MPDPITDAQRAQQILDDEVFQAALDALDDEYVDEWRHSSSLEARERAHVKQEVLGEVTLALERIMSDGLIAQHRNNP